METFIFKPDTVNSWKGGPVILVPAEGPNTPPVITTADGRTFTGKYVNTNEGRHQFVYPAEIIQESNLQVSYNGQSSTIESGAQSYEGGSLSGWQPRDKGSLGAGGSFSGGSGFPNQFQPGNIGYGAVPAYLGGEFPSPTFATFGKIKAAPYKYTDPFDFASRYGELARQEFGKFGEFARGEMGKNQQFSKDIAMDQLDTELQGLRQFVPAASALKRSEISLDNLFNQAQRNQQVDSTLPGARESLAAQTGRADIYAQGRLPDEQQDRALELGIRSRAADRAAAGGFGSASSASRKASDLMSAEQRFGIAQYGENLLGSSINNRANLLLAPTQYSDAGAQVRVMPSVSGSQLQSQAFGQLNQATIPRPESTVISPETALNTEVQQRQFRTNQIQGTRQFNASNLFAESQFNAGVANQFSLAEFGYNVGYAGTVAGASQTNINTQTALDQQQQAQDIFQDSMSDTQSSNSTGAIVTGAVGAAGFLWDMFGSDFTSGGSDISATGDSIVSGDQAQAPEVSSQFEGGGSSELNTGGESFARSSTTSATPPTKQAINYLDRGPTPFARQTAVAASAAATNPVHEQQLQALKDAGVDVSSYVPPGSEATTAYARAYQGAQKVMNISGLYDQPGPGRVQIGFDNEGKAIYAAPQLAKSGDFKKGQEMASITQAMMAPLKVMTPEDKKRFSFIEKAAGDPVFISKLQDLHQSGDVKGFISALTDFAVSLRPKAKQKYRKNVGKLLGGIELEEAA